MKSSSKIESGFERLAELAPAGYGAGFHISYASPLLTRWSYPKRWVDLYTERVYALRDPTTLWGVATQGATRWSEIRLPDPFGIMREAASYGLNFGATISCGPVRSRSIVSVARSDRELTCEEIRNAEVIVQELHLECVPPEALTPPQKDVLHLLALGISPQEGASRLRISERSFNSRLSGVKSALLARTAPEAVQRAADYGLID
ncbi:autoinducer binding domain-containing protein [Defluviimonas salinarum]|uniref:Autoinducer binding domain-containing protein n=1 Tax=Defluviimonas salinarum TaxID=2992147 RepID=A0ABT3J5F2_9RHOB|nr:autoinducer binding domain-containing protein [Defluviimonas salinarum]MCW3782898.1 autoinducer binding domain-containing protein [Defluviimonas salinarum]